MTIAHPSASQLAAFLLVALVSGRAAADCSEGGIRSWPESGGVLPANGRIVVEGFGDKQQSVENIARAHPRLQYGSHVIPLEVEAIRRGQFAVSEAVLTHKTAPFVGRSYELVLDPTLAAPELATKALGEPVPLLLRWRIGPPLTQEPRWAAAPRADGSQVISFGCGPGRWALVLVQVVGAGGEDAERILVELAPTDGSASPVTYLVPLKEPRPPPSTDPQPPDLLVGVRVGIGHGMCSGPFRLKNGVAYSARLSLVDLAGHVVPAPGEQLKLTIPETPAR